MKRSKSTTERPMSPVRRRANADFRRIKALIGKGQSVTKACAEVGRSREFYYGHLRDEPPGRPIVAELAKAS